MLPAQAYCTCVVSAEPLPRELGVMHRIIQPTKNRLPRIHRSGVHLETFLRGAVAKYCGGALD